MKDEYLESVSMSGLFRYLNEKDRRQACCELNMAPHSFRDQQIIYMQEESVNRAAIVHSGSVKGERLSDEGTSNLAYIYNRGDIFAFEGAVSRKKSSPLTLTAEGETTVVFFDVHKLFNSSFCKELITGLLELLANDDIKKLYRIEILSQRSLRARILSHFHVLAAKNGSTSFVLDMSREQLARYLCVNRSALSNELGKMKQDGIIDFQNRRITLLDSSTNER